AEGRSRFLTSAKPQLQRIAAPGLKLQIVKEVAELAKVSQDEAERLLDLRTPSSAWRRPGPARAASPAIRAFVDWWQNAPPAGPSGDALLIEKFAGTPFAEILFEAQKSLLDL